MITAAPSVLHFERFGVFRMFMDLFQPNTICFVLEPQHSVPIACDRLMLAANQTEHLGHMAKQQMLDNWQLSPEYL